MGIIVFSCVVKVMLHYYYLPSLASLQCPNTNKSNQESRAAEFNSSAQNLYLLHKLEL